MAAVGGSLEGESASRAPTIKTSMANHWWERDDLHCAGGSLRFGDREVAALARAAGTPLYLYSGARVQANLRRLGRALAARSLDHRVFYAMKANRHAPLLTLLKLTGRCGIDACSPGELRLALACGFHEAEISFTGTSLSDADLDCLGRHPEVWVNLDSLSAIRRLGERAPGREIGLRINPGLGVGYGDNELLQYSGSRTTKFGIYRDRFPEALALAREYGLRVTGLHLHTGCGYLTPQLPTWERILEASWWFIEQLPGLCRVNVGGGLGIPLVADDAPLDLEAWSAILARQLGGRGLQIHVEPGDYLVKDAGLLVLEVNTVERKEQTLFVGVNGGFNLHIEPAFYQLPLEVVPCRAPAPAAPLQRVTIAGNINEALDLLAENILLPPVAEGDLLALLNAGGYGAAMSSHHCARGEFTEYLLL
jgi:diaminopimelate decarboxylase